MKIINLRKITPLIILLLFVLCILGACEKDSTPSGVGPDLTVDSIELTDADRDFLIANAKALVTGKTVLDGTNAHPDLYAKKRSALFLSLTYPDKTVVLEFSVGNSIIDALENASGKAKTSVLEADRLKARVRIDVVTKTHKMISLIDRGKVAFKPSLHGLYLRTLDPVALHPLEIVSRGVVREEGSAKSKKWKYQSKWLQKPLEMRGVSSSSASIISSMNTILAKPFTTDSFVEGNDQKAIALYRWSPVKIEITPELLFERIDMAAKYLVSIVDKDGRFDYLYFPEKDSSSKSYNLLRHCGTIYSMVQMYEITKDPELLKAIERAIGFVMKNQLTQPREKDAHLAWKCIRGEGYKDRAKDQRSDYCKLGGGGLFLVGLSKYTMVTGDKQYLPTMEGLARFIQYMQEADGDMRSKYYFSDLPRKPFKSLFYPGEASYGLGLLYQIDLNKEWINTGHKAVAWLAKDRKGVKPIRLPIDHWLIIAMNELYKAQPNESNKQHVFDICKGIIQKQRVDGNKVVTPDIFGGWGSRPHSSSNGTQVEGLVAAYYLAKQSGDDPEPFLAAAWNAANLLVRLQYTEFGVSYFAKPDKIIGGYLAKIDVPEIQIDNVQHATSALIGIYYIMNSRQWRLPDTDLYDTWRNEAR